MQSSLNVELLNRLLDQGVVLITVNSELADIEGTKDKSLKLKLVNNNNTTFNITDEGIMLLVSRPRLDGFIPWYSIYEVSVQVQGGADDLLLEFPWARPEIQEYINEKTQEVENKIKAIEESYNLNAILVEVTEKARALYEELEKEELSIVARYFEARDNWEQEERLIDGEGEE